MGHHSILVVDDEHVFARNLAKLLTHRGYKAAYVLNGSAAISELGSEIYDLVLLDLRMPAMSGLETCKEIFRRNSDVKVVVLTGHGAEVEAFEAMKAGATGYLRKPIEVEEVIAEIERC
jgi:two-component system, NtrC family, response regulator AtoC